MLGQNCGWWLNIEATLGLRNVLDGRDLLWRGCWVVQISIKKQMQFFQVDDEQPEKKSSLPLDKWTDVSNTR